MINWLKKKFSKKVNFRQYDVDQNSVKTHHLLKAQQNQIAELLAIVGVYKVKEEERQESKRKKEEQENIKEDLDQQKKQLKKKQKQTFFSLKLFFQKYFKEENFRKKLNITTWDRGTNLGIFGDFGVIGNHFVILDEKNKPIMRTTELKDLFQSVNALGNDISSFKIPINLDKDRGYVENLLMYDLPEIIVGEDGIHYSKARKKPLYKLLQDKDTQIQCIREDLEESEEANRKLQDSVDDLESAIKLNTKSAEIARTERVKIAQRASNIEKAFKDIEDEALKLKQIYAIQEDNIVKLESQLTIMRKKAEGEEVKTSFDKALELVRNVKSEMVREQPEEIVKEEPKINDPPK